MWTQYWCQLLMADECDDMVVRFKGTPACAGAEDAKKVHEPSQEPPITLLLAGDSRTPTLLKSTQASAILKSKSHDGSSSHFAHRDLALQMLRDGRPWSRPAGSSGGQRHRTNAPSTGSRIRGSVNTKDDVDSSLLTLWPPGFLHSSGTWGSFLGTKAKRSDEG